MTKIKKVITVSAATIISVVVLLLFTPLLLSVFMGRDIAPIDDSNMRLGIANVLDSENAFFDLENINDEIDLSGLKNNNLSITDYLNSDEWKSEVIDQVIKDNQAALDDFTKASEKKNFQIPLYANPDEVTFNSLPPSLVGWREAARLSSIKALSLTKKGQTDQAFDEVFKSIMIGDMIERSQSDLLAYLVGLAVKEIGLDTMSRVIEISGVDGQELDRYQERLSAYQVSDNVAYLKIQYWILKTAALSLTGEKIEVPGVPVINRFYYKPNLSVSYNHEYFQNYISELERSCGDIRDISFKGEIEYKSATDKIKLYFTENAIGRMLGSMMASARTGVKEKKCEIQGKFIMLQEM